MCDYVPTVEVGFHFPEERGGVAGGLRARLSVEGLSGYATTSYCSRTHLALAEGRPLATERAAAVEVGRYPELADGQPLE